MSSTMGDCLKNRPEIKGITHLISLREMGGTKYKLFQVHVTPFELRGLTIRRVIWNPKPLLKHRIWRHQVNNQTIII